MKPVHNPYPLGHRLAGLDRRFEFHFAGGVDGLFSQTVRQGSQDANSIDLPLWQKQELESYYTLHAHAASFASVVRFRFGCDFSFRVTSLP